MAIDIDREWLQLRRLTTVQLRQRYLDIVGEAAHSHNKTWLLKRLAWRLQTLAEGDLSDRARQRAAELARDADLRARTATQPIEDRASALLPKEQAKASSKSATSRDARLPPPGSWLSRSYKGQTIQVKVLAQGFQYQGRVFSSLSALAKEITGSHCSGFCFFHLGRHAQGGQP